MQATSQESTIRILDSSCLLGVHRILKIISKPFSKLILPPGVRTIAWPNPIEVSRFAAYRASTISGSVRDAVEILGKINIEIQDIVNRERDAALELLNTLNRIGRLEMPDFNDWPRSEDDRSRDAIAGTDRFYDIYTPLLYEYISLPTEKQRELRVQQADLQVVAASIYHGHEIESFNVSIREYLMSAAIAKEYEKVNSYIFPCDLRTNELESYIDYVIKNQPTKSDLREKFGVSTVGTVVSDSVFIALKESVLSALGPVGSILSAGKEIVQIVHKYLENRELGRLQNNAIERIDPSNAALMEDVWSFIMNT